MEMLHWVKELGALGILAITMWVGLRWGARRIDRMLDQNERLINQFASAVESFKAFENEERTTHQRLFERLDVLERKIDRGNHGR